MADHEDDLPLGIDTIVRQLGELEIVFGVQVRPLVARASASLREALAARDRGDSAESIAKIGAAMDTLGGIADSLDPAEAAMMRGIIQMFRSALMRGDSDEARRAADVMFDRSGARYRKTGGRGNEGD